MGDETTAAEPRSRLEIALHTPVEELTDEQKALLNDSKAALSMEEMARLIEAGVLPMPEDPVPTEGAAA